MHAHTLFLKQSAISGIIHLLPLWENQSRTLQFARAYFILIIYFRGAVGVNQSRGYWVTTHTHTHRSANWIRKLLHIYERDYVCVIFCTATDERRRRRHVARAKSGGLRDFSARRNELTTREFLMIIIAAVCCNRVILPSDAALWLQWSAVRQNLFIWLLLHAGLVALLWPFQKSREIIKCGERERWFMCIYFSIAREVLNQGFALFFVSLNAEFISQPHVHSIFWSDAGG